MPHRMSKGQGKGSGQPAMNRSKQAGMDIKTIFVLAVGLTLNPASFAEAQQGSRIYRLGVLAQPGKLRNASK
jgi:hypothetical protein